MRTLLVAIFALLAGSCVASATWRPLAIPANERPDAEVALHGVEPRIFNGTPTADFPAVVGVALRLSAIEFGLCTGILIAPSVVLTAAHCVDDQPLQIVAAVIRNGTQENHAVTAVAINPRHVAGDVNGDVALLRLATPVDGVTPLPLARAKPRPGRTGTIVGFGQDGLGNVGRREVGTVRLGRCPRTLRRLGFTRIAALVCWSAAGGGSNTCEGDSGGPLLVNGAVAGITLGGTSAACGPSALSIDTSIAAYRAWIRRHLR